MQRLSDAGQREVLVSAHALWAPVAGREVIKKTMPEKWSHSYSSLFPSDPEICCTIPMPCDTLVITGSPQSLIFTLYFDCVIHLAPRKDRALVSSWTCQKSPRDLLCFMALLPYQRPELDFDITNHSDFLLCLFPSLASTEFALYL